MSDNFALQMFIRNQMGNQGGGGGAIDTGMSSGAGGNFISQQGGGHLKDISVLPSTNKIQVAALLLPFKLITASGSGFGLSLNFFNSLDPNVLGGLSAANPVPAAIIQPSKSKG